MKNWKLPVQSKKSETSAVTGFRMFDDKSKHYCFKKKEDEI